ncbi:MAG: hypothetical protein AAFP70_15960 [Calditrichota bacterium]
MKTLTISMSAILLLSSLLFAEDANTYYHMGAQGYIGGKLGEAIAAVERGLELEPGHPELQALYEKLKEQQEQQQQNHQDQQDQEKQQEQQQQHQDQQEQQEQEQEQQQNENEDDQEKDEQEQQQNQQEQNKDEEQQPPKPELGEEEKKDISKEEAERILQALRSKEKENKKLRKPKARGKGKVAKDW